jgi:hypothetical protein
MGVPVVFCPALLAWLSSTTTPLLAADERLEGDFIPEHSLRIGCRQACEWLTVVGGTTALALH